MENITCHPRFGTINFDKVIMVTKMGLFLGLEVQDIICRSWAPICQTIGGNAIFLQLQLKNLKI